MQVVAQGLRAERDTIFASTPGEETTRTMFAIAETHDPDVEVLEVSVAFMHAPLDKPIWTKPAGDIAKEKPGYIWKLKMAINGARIASLLFQEWFAKQTT